MRLIDAVALIETCDSVEALKAALQTIIERLGFASYAFLDLGDPGLNNPFVVNTVSKAWDADYRSNGFVHVDPILSKVLRENVPFTWADVRLPLQIGRRKSAARRLMEAAWDHRNREGYVVPFHYVDKIGRRYSASCGLFWQDSVPLFKRIVKAHRSDIRIIIIYWAQQIVEIAGREQLLRPRFAETGEDGPRVSLTDREREVLHWASQGKTMSETARILTISGETVETHTRSAIRKLGAVNKTQAVARAIVLGQIDT